MRHQLVGRSLIVLLALALAASLLFAWRGASRPPRASAPLHDARQPEGAGPVAPDASQREAGARHFARHCAGCHADADLVEPLGRGQALEDELAQMREFLAGHGGSSPDEDRLIVAYLRALASERP